MSKINEVQSLLKDNYVEDVTGAFRLAYSSEFLTWLVSLSGQVYEAST